MGGNMLAINICSQKVSNHWFCFVKFPCDLCDYVSPTNEVLRKHKEETHDTKPSKYCETCGRIFKDRRKLENHVERNHLQHQCEVCDFSGLFSQLDTHMKKKHPKHKPYKCEICTMEFATQFGRKNHDFYYRFNCAGNIKSIESKRDVICETCGEVFSNTKLLDKHNEKIHKIQPEMNHICETCGAGHSTKVLLYQHVKIIHGQKCFICILCDQKATKMSHIKKHLSESHNVLFKSSLSKDIYPCETCQQRFESTSDLDAHFANEHKQIQNNRCEDCDKVLVSKTLLLAHKMEFHQFNPIAPLPRGEFQCNICKKFLKTEKTLATHTLQEHEKEKHKHKCEKCSYTTFEPDRLRKHINTVHRDQKDFKCTQCKYVTNAQTRLNQHMTRRHGSNLTKVYKCPHCDHKEYRVTDFRIHLLNSHNVIYQGT